MDIMDNKMITGIILSIILGLLGWFKIKGFSTFDRYKIYKWLKSNTKDKTGESHVDTITIAKRSKLPEDRVRNAACLVIKFIVIQMARSNGVFGASNRKAVMKVYPKKRYLKE